MAVRAETAKNPEVWATFDSWRASFAITLNLNWGPFEDLFPQYRKIIEEKRNNLLSLLEKWDVLLRNYGNDPTYRDWNTFRPLRLSREEDWSDWIAFLIEASSTGSFAKSLLGANGFEEAEYSKPLEVKREEPHEGYRADLIVKWRNGSYTHIEVKIGDPNLEKTFPTCEVLMRAYKKTSAVWNNYILLLTEQLPYLDIIRESRKSPIVIIPITWDDVCISLRKALRSDETISWKSWGYAFIGAIEQILVGFSGHQLYKNGHANIDRKIRILEKGLTND